MDTSKRTAPATRVARGIALHRNRAGEITRTTAHTYRVPSCSGSGSYVVYMDADFEFCSCPDHRPAKSIGERCKHLVAVEVFVCKRRAVRRRRLAS